MTRTLAAAVLLILPAPLAAQDLFVHLSGFSAKLAGDLTGEDPTTEERTAFDLDDDLGFGFELALEGRAGLRLGRHRLSGAAAIFDHESEASRDFDFAGDVFTAEAQVQNKLRWVEGEYGFTVLQVPRGRLELLGGVRFFDYEATAQGELRIGDIRIPGSATLEESGPIPHVGAAFELRPLPLVVLRGTGKYMALGVGDDRGNELDLEGTVGVGLGALELGAGLRRLDLDASFDDDETTLDFNYTGLAFYVRFGV